MNILIAEDDFISRKLLRNILEELGHQVTAAKDGEEALGIFESAPTRLVILDWLMPKMDGIELVRNIRQREEGKSPSDYTYVIMLTANFGQRSSYYEAIDAGVDDFLAKPLERIELAARLRVAERILKAGSRIKSLENILTICAYTKKVKFPESGWQTIEEFMQRQLGISVSHGIEPTYYEKHIRPQIDALKQTSDNGR
jgi:DNA-binding response OmpR family regulator